MKAFKMDWDDLVFNSFGNIEYVYDEFEIRQSIERICTTNITEWFLNIDFGLDYDAISGKGKGEEGIKLALRTAIFQDKRIVDIDFKELELNRGTRLLTVMINATIDTGEIIEGIEVNIIE